MSEDRMCTAPSLHVMAEEAKKSLTSSEQVEVRCVMPQVERIDECFEASCSVDVLLRF